MAHPSGESPRPLLACLFLVLAASFCDGYAPLLAQNPLNKAVRRSIHAPRATGVFTIPAGPFAPPLGAKGKPGRRGADLVHMSVLEDIGDPAQLKDNAAILLEACGLERADAVRFVDCCNEVDWPFSACIIAMFQLACSTCEIGLRLEFCISFF